MKFPFRTQSNNFDSYELLCDWGDRFYLIIDVIDTDFCALIVNRLISDVNGQRLFKINEFNLRKKSCKCINVRSFRIILWNYNDDDERRVCIYVYVFVKTAEKDFCFFFFAFSFKIALRFHRSLMKSVTRVVYYISKLQMTLKLRFISKFKMYHRSQSERFFDSLRYMGSFSKINAHTERMFVCVCVWCESPHHKESYIERGKMK